MDKNCIPFENSVEAKYWFAYNCLICEHKNCFAREFMRIAQKTNKIKIKTAKFIGYKSLAESEVWDLNFVELKEKCNNFKKVQKFIKI